MLHGLVKHIDLGLGELARTDPSLEEEVEFGKRPSIRLRDPEERVYDAKEADAAPEEAGIVAPIPCAGVQHVRGQDTADDGDDVVQVAAEHDRLDLKAAGGELGDKGVGDRADGQLVEERPYDHHGAGCQGGLGFVLLGY